MSAATLPAVSVILPIYGVEKFLPACLASLQAQTFTDYELILVDDGSPDEGASAMNGLKRTPTPV